MTFLCGLSSAILLIVSYPQIDLSPLAWVALVPLLFIIDGQKPFKAFTRAYWCGLLFFSATFGWLVYVTYPGAILMMAYLSLYFGFFGLGYTYIKPLPLPARLVVASALWVALEFLRANLFTGFGWALLGHSQYKNLLLIQIADITGVYGVSFLVMLVNVLFFETLRVAFQNNPLAQRTLFKTQMAVVALLLGVLGYGFWSAQGVKSYPTVKIGVVQPNIPQDIKWESYRQPDIVNKTIALTRLLQNEKPDIIIWPETSLPGIISEVPELAMRIQATAQDMKIPLLVGTIGVEGQRYYNSAYLVSSEGQMQLRQDKIHLVPFGEFLPLRPILGWINRFVPLEDFSSGQEYTIFPVGCPQKKFGVLICFEDTLGYLRRNFARAGAQFFVNMTNDAWFHDTKAPFLHLQAAVLGCVENKRALVRSANTGISTFVDPWGRIAEGVHNDSGKKTFIAGVAVGTVPLISQLTFYTKYGDVFTYLCFACILTAMVWTRRKSV